MSIPTGRLADRLADLADDGDDDSRLPSGADMWRRGRSRQRRQRIGAAVAVVAAVVLLAALTAVGLPQLQHGQQEPAGTQAGLPSKIYDPSPYLAGTAAAGPIGPLSVITYADRKTLLHTTRRAPVGISAKTGEYRFLDLPDLESDSEIALSPDGRYVAYPLAGTPPKLDRQVETGVAVYDTTTGRVQREDVDAGYGIEGATFFWASSRTLFVSYETPVKVTDKGSYSSADSSTLYQWHPGERLGDRSQATFVSGILGSGEGAVVALGGYPEERLQLVDPDDGTVVSTYNVTHRLDGGPIVPGPDRASLATVVQGGVGVYQWPLTIITPSGRRTVGPALWQNVVGWADASHVVVYDNGSPDDPARSMQSVDIDTGARTTVLKLTDTGGATVATDLLGRGSMPAVRPASARNSRLLVGLGLLVVLSACAALMVWRRRVRI